MGALDWIGDVTEPTRVIAAEIDEAFDLPHYGAPYDGEVMWGYNSGGKEHGSGRALDVMVDSEPAVGDAVAEWLWSNRYRYGLIHLIWKRHIRSTRVSPGEKRLMPDRGSPTENHMDHVHAYFDGRRVGTSLDIPVTPPPPEPRERFYTPVGVSLSVEEIQRAVNVAQDGFYGADTRAAVLRLQKRLGVPADGYWGPVTEEAWQDAHDPKPEPGGGRRPPKFELPQGHWYGVESSDPKNHSGYWPKDRDGIKRFQRRMKNERGWRGMGAIDGVFGTKTEAVVKKFQRQKGLKVDGLVGIKTWNAMWTEPVT